MSLDLGSVYIREITCSKCNDKDGISRRLNLT